MSNKKIGCGCLGCSIPLLTFIILLVLIVPLSIYGVINGAFGNNFIPPPEVELPAEVIFHKEYGRKASEVAPFFGVRPEAVLKTLTFLDSGGNACLVLLSQASHVDEKDLAEEFSPGFPIRLAKAAEVLELTGHEIGGVPPFGAKLPLFIDSACLKFGNILVAAGVPSVSVKLAASDLLNACPGAKVVTVSGKQLSK